MERKLVSVRKIAELNPIPGADAIEVATIDGWKVVVKKGEFKVNDLCAYFEIDSFLPESDPRYAFLMKSGVREFEGVRGHKLRTIKLRGQISQGLALPIAQFVDDFVGSTEDEGQELSEFFTEGTELTQLLGIKKYEAPISAELAGQVAGNFPSFIKKTDQERCQNLKAAIFGYDDELRELNVTPEQLTQEAIESGRVRIVAGKVYALHPAKADRNAVYEISMKLDGSSATFYHNNGDVGVCSRNLELKVNEDNKDNSFVKMFVESKLILVLPEFGNIAIQGELMGPGIQGNRENLKQHKLFIFDAQNLDTGEYFSPEERQDLMTALREFDVPVNLVDHVPVLHYSTLQALNLHSTDDLLKFAEGPSIANPVREGLVFKRSDGKFSFKAISNVFLAKEKD